MKVAISLQRHAEPMLDDRWRGRRIAIVLGALLPGSRERVIVELAERLANAGAAVDLLIPGASPSSMLKPGSSIRIRDIGLPLTGGLPNIVRIALSSPLIAAYLRRKLPDAVLSLSIPPNLATLAAERLSDLDLPVVIRQSNVIRIDGSSRYGHVDRRPRDRLIRSLYRDADAIIAVSEGVADNLRQLIDGDRNRIETIANGVLVERIDRLAAAPSPHRWLDDHRVPVVVAVGRLVRKKDYPTLLGALAKLRARRDVRLIILGEGPKRRSLQKLCHSLHLDDAVALPGRVENPFAYLSRASLYALSSTFEGMPSALIEALVCGCPVVSTDCPSGPSEILDDGCFGRLVPIGDIEGLADAMYRSLAERPLRDRQRARGLTFSAEKTIDGYLAVLDQVCASDGR